VFFHAIEQASHIGISGNHTFGDASTKNAFRLGASKDAQDVVLCPGERGGFEEALDLLRQGVGGPEERNEEQVF
jgi:hypothetical protein